VVHEQDAERAREALDAFDDENRPAAAEAERGAGWLGAAVALALCALFLAAGDDWRARGAADAARILDGEWWRAIAALTLHADFAHVASNAFAAFILLGALDRALGPGLAAWLALAGGALGNALTAWVHGANHFSVGASTAIFAALGALAVLAARRRAKLGRRGRLLAVGAALALFAVLGTGKGTDILAHLFGLVAGAFLAAPLSLVRPPGRAVQWILVVLACAAIAGAWVIAFHRGATA
jgi:membrane associated rhomboid family serine protease